MLIGQYAYQIKAIKKKLDRQFIHYLHSLKKEMRLEMKDCGGYKLADNMHWYSEEMYWFSALHPHLAKVRTAIHLFLKR